MSSSKPSESAAINPYAGPRDDEPLTEEELAILLAIPRAAENIPNAIAFRIPLGIDPSMGWIDVTWSEARSIIARLAAIWGTRLSDMVADKESSPIGPGTTICLFVQPSVIVLFHILAFWALGCTPQFLSLSLDPDTIDLYLNQSGCRVAIYSGISENWVGSRREVFCGTMIPLPKDEYAHRLAEAEKQSPGSAFSWPEPRRPTPAVILHSSGTTGLAKLCSFSLYFYTLGPPPIASNGRTTAQDIANTNIKTPYNHPHLIFSPPYWQSFYNSLFRRLVAGIPTALACIPDMMKFPSNQFMVWVRALDVGSVSCAPRYLCRALQSESDIALLRSLYMIVTSGSALDNTTSDLIEKHKLKFTNAYGCTEMTGILYATKPPYTHLRITSIWPALVYPISDTQPDGSCQVQLWHSISTSRQLAHLYAKGGVPLRIEPYPGPGPHQGEPAVNLGDVFEQVGLPPNSDRDFAYVYLGRSDDMIKLAGGGGWNMNAALYESRIQSLLDSHLIGWTVDAIQLFGSNLLCTALVVQVSEAHGAQKTDANPKVGHWVEEVNKDLKLGPRRQVHTQKRLLVITPDDACGPAAEYIKENRIRLSTTHKHTLQRWKNVEAFQVWLNMLDFSEE
ncbi:unnamed protein product [Rhizoctonia solani]|uniref:AMP-dependent synthetase/ligase domain-containing protein n=1 Tax=Rhizoctonia solani TaxID=456999 RepID=A0A8H2XDL1_9AGAM|nr:unnamed protein product [Rhizoctonia solani]